MPASLDPCPECGRQPLIRSSTCAYCGASRGAGNEEGDHPPLHCSACDRKPNAEEVADGICYRCGALLTPVRPSDFDEPADRPRRSRPPYTLASPGQVGLAAFLGGPMAGFLLIARNYAKLGRGSACAAAIAAGVMLTVAAVGFGIWLPDNTGPAMNLAIAAPLWIATYLAALALQKSAYDVHVRRGGGRTSGWALIGFVVLGVALTFGVAFLVVGLYETGFGDRTLKVTPSEEILYGRDIPEADARALGKVLQEHKYFDGVGDKTVLLHKEKDGYVLMLILLSGHDDPQVHQECRELAGGASHALGGKPVQVELCDQWQSIKKKLPAEQRP
jgi:hypothetical protein